MTNATAYGWKHQTRREELLPAAIGTDCPLCGYEMRIGQALDLDHSVPLADDPASVGDRIVHAECNRKAGARNHRNRQARVPRTCVICGLEFFPSHSSQRACGRPCGVELRRRNLPPPKQRIPVQYDRQCSECLAAFTTNRSNKFTCSPECVRDRVVRRVREATRSKAKGINRSVRPDPRPSASRTHWSHPCRECGGPIPVTGQRGRPAVRCDDCRNLVEPSRKLRFAQELTATPVSHPSLRDLDATFRRWMLVGRECASCGGSLEAKRSHARFCNATCRKRSWRMSVPAEVPAEAAAPSPEAAAVVEVTRRQLEAAGQVETVLGRQALVLAGRLGSTRETGSAVAAVSRELRAVMAEAMRGIAAEADPLDDLRARRDRKRAAAG